MDTRIAWLMFLVAALLILPEKMLAEAAKTDPWGLLAEGRRAILIRHALAPGFGDPPNFQLDDCATQRNLSEAGRQQARRIGALFRQHDVKIDAIYTSQWCRCRETAELLGLGRVESLPILNSFFQQREREQQQTEALERFLLTTPHTGVIILVTHQVNITALTGIYPASGEAVIVGLEETKPLRVLGTLAFAPD